MKVKEFSKYLGIFILGVLLIAVYKTFDSIDYIFSYIKKVFSILLPVFIAIGISVFLYPICAFLEKWYAKCKWQFISKKRRMLAVLSVYLVFVTIIVLVFSFIVPGLVSSLYNFIIQFPDYISNMISALKSIEFLNIDIDSIMENFDFYKIWNNIDLDNINKYASGVIDFSSIFANIFIAIIMSIYILIDRHDLKELVKKISKKLLNEKVYLNVARYIKKLSEYLYKYLYCLLLDGIIIFVLSFILMLCLRIKYAPILALFIGLFNIIPYFGAIIAVLITCVITIFTASFSKALILAISLIVLQQIDSNIIQPKLVRDSFSIKPLWVIIGVLLGGGLFGVIGIILAVPVMGLIKLVLEEHL